MTTEMKTAELRVLDGLIHTFNLAKIRQREIYETWVRISFRVGGRLPASLLSVAIQRDGELDLLLRCLEDEQVQRVSSGVEPGLLDAHYLMMFSVFWVGSMYETFRLLRQRKRMGTSQVFHEIFRDLELLRIPLEKHEIAKDRKLDQPLQMTKSPPNNDSTDYYSYDPKDHSRAHIMPAGLSSRGSMTWQAIDGTDQSSRWIERRPLSDRILDLWKNE
jgi:hypothetical protein